MSHLYSEILQAIEDPSLPDRAMTLLRSASPSAQKTAVELLINNPTPDALDRLWELRRTLEGDEVNFFFKMQVEDALAACVKLKPEWLVHAIQHVDPNTEPFSVLVYLLVRIAEIEGGENFWVKVREIVFAKTPSRDKRALFYVSEGFRDPNALARLKDSIHQDEDLVAAAAMRALGLMDLESALAALEDAPLESSLLLARSWWLPHLLAFSYELTSEILFRKIQGHAKPWAAVAVYDGRENRITPEILDLLLGLAEERLREALAQSEPDNKDSLARPFRFLSKVVRLDLLRHFEALQDSPFEQVLTEYMIRQGPNDEGWHRWKVWDGIAILQRIGGKGFTRLANYYLESAKTRLGIRDGFLLGVRRPNEETVRLVLEIAHDPKRGGQMENGFPLVQYETVKALAALGQWRQMVQACLRLGLKTPKSLPNYLEGHVLTNEDLADALNELRSGTPSPGALLAVGFSGRSELASEVRAIYETSDRDSERSLACLLALESLGDRDSEDLFIENLDSPKNSWVAVRALLGAVRTKRGDEALLGRLRQLGTKEESDQQLLAMNLLILEETRLRAAKLLWQHLNREQLLYYAGDTIEYLSVLDSPEVKDFLWETAFSDQRGTWHGGDRHAAIEGLRSTEPDAAFQATVMLFRSDDSDRVFSPETLLKINREEALTLIHDTLATTKDFLLVAAIGEALDHESATGTLGKWLEDKDFRVREGACFVMNSVRWSQELEDMILSRLHDPSWDVRAAARTALDKLLLSKETERLAEEVVREENLARRWVLVDSALTIGYPGVVVGYGAHSWFGRMIEGQPYPLRGHALSKLEERRKKLREELAKRER